MHQPRQEISCLPGVAVCEQAGCSRLGNQPGYGETLQPDVRLDANTRPAARCSAWEHPNLIRGRSAAPVDSLPPTDRQSGRPLSGLLPRRRLLRAGCRIHPPLYRAVCTGGAVQGGIRPLPHGGRSAVPHAVSGLLCRPTLGMGAQRGDGNRPGAYHRRRRQRRRRTGRRLCPAGAGRRRNTTVLSTAGLSGDGQPDGNRLYEEIHGQSDVERISEPQDVGAVSPGRRSRDAAVCRAHAGQQFCRAPARLRGSGGV